jgi:hypothetical protein
MAKEAKIEVQAAQLAYDAAHPKGAGTGVEGDEDTDEPKPKAKKQKVSMT